jgi:hypothetical protein
MGAKLERAKAPQPAPECTPSSLSSLKGIHSSYSISIQWNGTFPMTITPNLVKYKDVNISANDVDVTKQGGVYKVVIKAFIPKQTTEWLPGQVGMMETFTLRVGERDGSANGSANGSVRRVKGTFQRSGEGPLECEFERIESAEEASERMPTLQRQLSSDDSCCPICFELWSTPGLICIQTACSHQFCYKCVTSCCHLTPPNTEGICPLCRGGVRMEELKKVEVFVKATLAK